MNTLYVIRTIKKKIPTLFLLKKSILTDGTSRQTTVEDLFHPSQLVIRPDCPLHPEHNNYMQLTQTSGIKTEGPHAWRFPSLSTRRKIYFTLILCFDTALEDYHGML